MYKTKLNFALLCMLAMIAVSVCLTSCGKDSDIISEVVPVEANEFNSDENQELESFILTEELIAESATVSRGGTACQVSCFWGSATAICPGGGAICYCSWGSPITYCSGRATVAGRFNIAAVQEIEKFIIQNQINPIVIESVRQLQSGFESGSWDEYLQAQENYVKAIEDQPIKHQEMIEKWLGSGS